MSKRIKERRLEMNLTQEELAAKLNLQKSAVAKYENGRVENIKRSTIEKMAVVLNCKPSYLMGWESPPQSSNFSLSDTEKQIILAYRQADEIGRAMVLRSLGLEEVAEKSNAV